MDFEKTQNKLDELRNLTWQNGKLIEQVETLTNMLKEKDDNALVVEIKEAKKNIADAINTKGGNSTPDESFQQLANDIQTMPTSGIFANGITQTEPFSFLMYITTNMNNEITEIYDSEITTISRNFAFCKNIALREAVMTGVTSITSNNVFQGCNSLQSVQLPNLVTISGASVFQSCNSLQSVQLPNLVTISGTSVFQGCISLQSVQLPNLVTISGTSVFQSCISLQSVQLPNLVTISGNNVFLGCDLLQTITFGVLVVCLEPFYDQKKNLRNITIGENTDIDLRFKNWTATNVITEGQSGIDELNSNLYNNLLTKLYDHSTDGQTRTLRLGWLAHVTQENIDYANSKGWTLTT